MFLPQITVDSIPVIPLHTITIFFLYFDQTTSQPVLNVGWLVGWSGNLQCDVQFNAILIRLLLNFTRVLLLLK